MKCGTCHRRFRSRAAYELAQKRTAIIESLRNDTPAAHLSPKPDRVERHRKESEHWKQHAEKMAA